MNDTERVRKGMRERERQRHKNQCQKIGEKGYYFPNLFSPTQPLDPACHVSRISIPGKEESSAKRYQLSTETETVTRRYRDLIYPAIMKDKVITPSHLFFQPKDKINDEE